MKKIFLLSFTILLLGISNSYVQKFYVEKTDDGFEQPIIDKLISENYRLSFIKDSANYIIKCVIGRTGMGRARGYILIIDNKSGDLISKSKEGRGQTAIWHAYANPRMLAMQKIADKFLIKLVKNINNERKD